MSRNGAISAIFVIFMVILDLDIARGRPAETPTKFNLDTSSEGIDRNGQSSPTKWEQGMGLASEARNNVASIIAVKSDILSQGSTAINSFVTSSPFESFLPPKVRETVRLESENGQALFETRKKNPIGNLIEMYLRPTALVDKIREEDKYGNTGDKFIGIGRALVDGFEGLSNFLNTVVDFPIDTAKKTSRGFSEALNQLGGRLVGLQ